MKNWLIRLPGLKEIYRWGSMDAFHKAHADILGSMQEELDRRAETLALKKLEQLLTVVDESAIVSIDARTKVIKIGGEQVDAMRLNNLKSESEFFNESDLWKVLYETPKKLAENAMFVDDGKIESQLLKGRAVLYTLATQKKILDIFKSLSTGT